MKRLTILSIAFMLISCAEEPKAPSTSKYPLMEIATTNQLLTLSYSATINGRQVVEIRPQVAGFITQVCVEEGATVKKGQTLFIIDQVPYQAALQTAKANVESAQASVATAELTAQSKQELLRAAVVSDFDLQTALNTLKMQKAALSQAQAAEINARNNLSYTVVKSPSDGVIGMIAYRVGALVSSSIATPLVTVSDDSQMHIYFSMTENQILALARQNSSSATVIDSMPEVGLQLSDGQRYAHNGKIDAISGIVNATTGAIAIRATFPNAEKLLRSGGAGNVIFPYQKNNCIVIPQEATYEIQDKLFVYRAQNGIAKSAPITAFSVNDGKNYIIEEGLNVGDTIVASGVGLLRDGAKI